MNKCVYEVYIHLQTYFAAVSRVFLCVAVWGAHTAFLTPISTNTYRHILQQYRNACVLVRGSAGCRDAVGCCVMLSCEVYCVWQCVVRGSSLILCDVFV